MKVALLLVVFVLPASAQWRANHSSVSQPGVSQPRMRTGHGSIGRGPVPGNVYRSGSYYPSVYGPGYLSNGSYYSPEPAQYVPGGASVVSMDAPLAPPVTGYNLYVPTYLRPDDGGPSLAERAASVRVVKKTSVINWSNWSTTATTEKKD